jgi:hypothetical protein
LYCVQSLPNSSVLNSSSSSSSSSSKESKLDTKLVFFFIIIVMLIHIKIKFACAYLPRLYYLTFLSLKIKRVMIGW